MDAAKNNSTKSRFSSTKMGKILSPVTLFWQVSCIIGSDAGSQIELERR